MKTPFLATIALCISTLAFAGGVTDGGGGTTNPNPARPEWIVNTVRQYATQSILTWLITQKDWFESRSIEERQRSPYRHLFAGRHNVFDLVKATGIELAMSTPCLDALNQPRDGSVYAFAKGYICISPFSMAPKLTESNYDEETIALVIHEIAHLAGADEDEATTIQKEALWVFDDLDLLDLRVKIELLADGTTGGLVADAMFGIDHLIAYPDNIRESDIAILEQRLLSLRDEKLRLGSSILAPSVISARDHSHLSAQFVRYQVVSDYVCAHDAARDAIERDTCAQRLQTGFGNDAEVSAGDYLNRIDGLPTIDPHFADVKIARPTSSADLGATLGQIRDFLIEIREKIRAIDRAKMPIARR